jgi:hypothetical protein
MKESDQAKLLHGIARRIIIDPEGEIIDHELHSPFAYLRSIVDEFSTENTEECGSEQPLGERQRTSSMLDSFNLLCYFTIQNRPFFCNFIQINKEISLERISPRRRTSSGYPFVLLQANS